jgi:hypothetical protein
LNKTEHDSPLGLERQERPGIISRNIEIGSLNFIVEPGQTADMFIGEDGQSEVDDQNKSDSGMEEVSQEGCFQPAYSGV